MRLAVFLLFLIACGAAAATGIVFQPGSWYAGLSKPAWTPPNIAFPLIWTILYILMAAAAARVATLRDSGIAIGFWAVQIALNTLWSPVFFGAHRMDVGFFVIVALWLALIATIAAFWRLDRLAAVMLLPYLAWITLAAALNWTVWQLNPAASA